MVGQDTKYYQQPLEKIERQEKVADIKQRLSDIEYREAKLYFSE